MTDSFDASYDGKVDAATDAVEGAREHEDPGSDSAGHQMVSPGRGSLSGSSRSLRSAAKDSVVPPDTRLPKFVRHG